MIFQSHDRKMIEKENFFYHMNDLHTRIVKNKKRGNEMLDKICPICENPRTLIDHDDSDGLFAGWEWQCSNCDNKEKEGESVSYTHLDVYKRQIG